MNIRWNKFEGCQFKPNQTDEPRVTVDNRGVFNLNEAAWKALDRPAAVEFFVDDSGRIFGMKGCDPREKSAFQVKSKPPPYKYHRISAAAFFQHLRMRIDRTVLFRDIDLDNSGVLMLDMNTSVNVTRGAR
jgi:hypothetical protein